MIEMLLLGAIVLFLCLFTGKIFYKYGVPLLLIFILLGMAFGSDGFVGIQFNNYALARDICSVGLMFIIFFGGFGTNWKVAKPVAPQAILLSTVGVVVTALLVGGFCYYIIGLPIIEGFLIGSVIASTDAASVFSILKSRKLNLKNNLASLLEIESGSNDPFSFMLTVILLGMMGMSVHESTAMLMIKQIGIGASAGVLIALLSSLILKRIIFEIEGLYPIFMISTILMTYSLAEFYHGNGYLAVYLFGLILGNTKFIHRRSLVNFFDGISWLMQIMLFFTLGLLSFPGKLPYVWGYGVSVALFLLVVARPIAVMLVLTPFKVPFKQQLFVSWVGLRGAASMVFAIYAVASGVNLKTDLFHIVFFVALLSVTIQGGLIGKMAKWLDVVEAEDDDQVLKTFNDYRDTFLDKVVEMRLKHNHPWIGKSIMEADIPENILVLMIRRGEEYLIPKGFTVIQENDLVIMTGDADDIENGLMAFKSQVVDLTNLPGPQPETVKDS